MHRLLKILLLIILLVSCSTKKTDLDSDSEIIPEVLEDENTYNDGSPFYPLKESIDDLQYQINELKARVTEYESTLHAPSLNAEILKLIKSPTLNH